MGVLGDIVEWGPGLYCLLEFHLVVAFALFAIYPVIAFIRGPLRRRRRQRKGLCVRCGYNLTGNVSGVCPECGTEAGKETASSDRPDE
jgi:hypothetical protein